ncbi:hypothetical protein Ciccas_009641 [Cichlidogyrus casuarinus]|uniref:Uncharacterized protein n=1 Tax=Cichlidogyrus casuarinus TaxID=1844966 RepID=A0ABD2PWF2_9PLAT
METKLQEQDTPVEILLDPLRKQSPPDLLDKIVNLLSKALQKGLENSELMEEPVEHEDEECPELDLKGCKSKLEFRPQPGKCKQIDFDQYFEEFDNRDVLPEVLPPKELALSKKQTSIPISHTRNESPASSPIFETTPVHQRSNSLPKSFKYLENHDRLIVIHNYKELLKEIDRQADAVRRFQLEKFKLEYGIRTQSQAAEREDIRKNQINRYLESIELAKKFRPAQETNLLESLSSMSEDSRTVSELLEATTLTDAQNEFLAGLAYSKCKT